MNHIGLVVSSRRLECLILSCVFFASAVLANAAPYQLNPKAKNRVEFQSSATLESFSGKAKNITADFEIDPAILSKSTGKLTVDLRTLDTGLELRNKHMRENHLNTDSFPNAVFDLDSVTGATAMASTGATNLTIHGTMTVHGVTRQVSAPGTLQAANGPAGTLQVRTEFPLKITDYDIPRPEFLFLKLAEEVKIVVDVTLEPVHK